MTDRVTDERLAEFIEDQQTLVHTLGEEGMDFTEEARLLSALRELQRFRAEQSACCVTPAGEAK